LAWGEVVLLFLVAGEGLALGELLAGALVGLAHGEVAAQLELLLGLLGEVVFVALVLVLGLFLLDVVGWWGNVRVETLGLFGLSDGLAGLLIGKLGVTGLSAPAVGCLLGMLAVDMC
jgi:hypothetical protein